MLSVITGFVDELREAGLPVSMVEAIDAMKAVEAIDVGSRVALRETLRATLVKNLRHERAFDTAFDVYFSTIPASAETDRPSDVEGESLPSPPGEGGGGDPEFDLDQPIRRMRSGIAALQIEGYIGPGKSRAAIHYTYTVQ